MSHVIFTQPDCHFTSVRSYNTISPVNLLWTYTWWTVFRSTTVRSTLLFHHLLVVFADTLILNNNSLFWKGRAHAFTSWFIQHVKTPCWEAEDLFRGVAAAIWRQSLPTRRDRTYAKCQSCEDSGCVKLTRWPRAAHGMPTSVTETLTLFAKISHHVINYWLLQCRIQSIQL